MPALNRVQLIGYLGKYPESKYTSGGRKVTGHLFEQVTVGRQRQILESVDLSEHRNQSRQLPPDQRLAAGQPYGVYAQVCHHSHHALDLLEGEDL